MGVLHQIVMLSLEDASHGYRRVLDSEALVQLYLDVVTQLGHVAEPTRVLGSSYGLLGVAGTGADLAVLDQPAVVGVLLGLRIAAEVVNDVVLGLEMVLMLRWESPIINTHDILV